LEVHIIVGEIAAKNNNGSGGEKGGRTHKKRKGYSKTRLKFREGGEHGQIKVLKS